MKQNETDVKDESPKIEVDEKLKKAQLEKDAIIKSTSAATAHLTGE